MEGPVFSYVREQGALVITPSRNISSLAEDEVQQQWDSIVSELDEPEVQHIVF